MPGPDWLDSDEVIITVGVLRYAQLSCLQVSPPPVLTTAPSANQSLACTHLDRGMPCALRRHWSLPW